MEEITEIIGKCPLFVGISGEKLAALPEALGGRSVQMRKGQVLLGEGDRPGSVGIVLAGSVYVVREDCLGSRSVLTRIPPAGVFGESYACARVEALPVSVIAEEDGAVLLLDCGRMLAAGGPYACIPGNLLRLMARKNLELSRKIRILSRRSTREKLMAYLVSEAELRGSSAFRIPFDRQALADFLEVDRSGLSAEISRLRREGVLRCEKNFFELL